MAFTIRIVDVYSTVGGSADELCTQYAFQAIHLCTLTIEIYCEYDMFVGLIRLVHTEWSTLREIFSLEEKYIAFKNNFRIEAIALWYTIAVCSCCIFLHRRTQFRCQIAGEQNWKMYTSRMRCKRGMHSANGLTLWECVWDVRACNRMVVDDASFMFN